MEVMRDKDTAWKESEPATFSGRGRIKRLPDYTGDPNVRVYRVEFDPTVRTNWHTHSGLQILLVAEGKCRLQKEGGPVQEIGAGDMAFFPASEKHWHGASPDGGMTHIAINLGAETNWLEPVTDEQYSKFYKQV